MKKVSNRETTASGSAETAETADSTVSVKKKRVIGVPFPKGKSGNPNGRPKVPARIRQIQEITYTQFIERLRTYGACTRKEIERIVDDQKMPILDLIYCRHLIDAMNGEDKARETLYNRLWGKVKEQIEHFGVGANGPQIIVTLPDNGRSINLNDDKSYHIEAECESKDEKNTLHSRA